MNLKDDVMPSFCMQGVCCNLFLAASPNFDLVQSAKATYWLV